MIKKLIKAFETNKLLREKNELLEQNMKTLRSMITNLEKENTKLKDVVVSSVELVDSYKHGMTQLRRYFQQQVTEQYYSNEEYEQSEDEEEEVDIYKALRKKTTVH